MLSKALGMERREICKEKGLFASIENCQINAHNRVIDDLDQREASVEKLANLLRTQRNGHSGFPPAEWDYEQAKQIISAMNINHPETWIVRKV